MQSTQKFYNMCLGESRAFAVTASARSELVGHKGLGGLSVHVLRGVGKWGQRSRRGMAVPRLRKRQLLVVRAATSVVAPTGTAAMLLMVRCLAM